MYMFQLCTYAISRVYCINNTYKTKTSKHRIHGYSVTCQECYHPPADFGSHDKASLKPLLFPCGSLRRETLPTVLPEGGVNVHSIVCYNTVADPNIARNLRGLAEKKVKKTSVHF